MPHKNPENYRDYQREYATKNAEKKRLAAKQWRDADPERSRQSRRDYVAKNRDIVYADARERHEANRDELNERRRQRRRKPGGKTPHERLRDDLITTLWHEQGGRCYLCDEPVDLVNATLDHDHRCCPLGRVCRFCARGATCANCNKMIGHANDNPERLERVARNLRRKLAEIDMRLAQKPVQPILEFLDEKEA